MMGRAGGWLRAAAFSTVALTVCALPNAAPSATDPPSLNCGLSSLRSLVRLLAVPTLSGHWLQVVDGFGDRETLSLAELIEAGSALGVELTGWEMTPEELSEYRCPAIVHLKHGHFVTFIDVVGNDVRVLDDDGRLHLMPVADFEEEYSGRCLVPGDSPALQPRLVFEELHHDSGRVGHNQRARHAFVCHNTGAEPIKLGVLRASPRCAARIEGEPVVTPGESSSILVEGSIPPGAFQAGFWVEIVTDGPARRVRHLTLSAMAPQKTRAVPDRLGGSLPIGQGGGWTVTIRGPLGVQVQRAASDNELISVDIRTDDVVEYEHKGARYTPLTIRVATNAPAGEHAGKVTVTTSDPQAPVITIPVSVRIRSRVTLTPPDIFFGKVRPGATAETYLHLLATDPPDLPVPRVTCNVPGVSVSPPRAAPEGGCLIKVRFRPECAGGVVKGILSVAIPPPIDELLEVPVFAFVTDETRHDDSRHSRRKPR